ncbi:MAG: D-hexose-6-phosphate mutarotase [Pseudomonadota bacterium]
MSQENSDTRFGKLLGVTETVEHGLAAVRVQTASASGLVFLQGAHIAAWTPATVTDGSIIWMSENAVYAPGKALRGGIPICFPWFGAHPEHAQFPAHGFARVREFAYHGARLTEDGGAELEFGLESDAQTQSLFPYAFSARLRVAFGTVLSIELTVTNRDAATFSFEEALHSYFSVSDVEQASLLGLEGASYADKVEGMAQFTQSATELRFTGETDRVYESTNTCVIRDLGRVPTRMIQIEKTNSGATVVWNPWPKKAEKMPDLGLSCWRSMLCVESANVGRSKVTLAPGQQHRLAVRVRHVSS